MLVGHQVISMRFGCVLSLAGVSFYTNLLAYLQKIQEQEQSGESKVLLVCC